MHEVTAKVKLNLCLRFPKRNNIKTAIYAAILKE